MIKLKYVYKNNIILFLVIILFYQCLSSKNEPIGPAIKPENTITGDIYEPEIFLWKSCSYNY